MRHIIFEEQDTYRIAVLVKGSSFREKEIRDNYITPLQQRGVSQTGIIAFNLPYNEANKAPAKFIKEYLEQLLPSLNELGAEYLLVTDANYFKTLTGKAKAEPYFGYVLPCKIKGYEHFKVILSLNYQTLIYNPDLQAKLDLSLDTLSNTLNGSYVALGENIIHSAWYPTSVEEIAQALEQLKQHPQLACDIEGFSLRFNEAGIGTIAFAWDEHNGLAFPCDYVALPNPDEDGNHGTYFPNFPVRKLLKEFFSSFLGEVIWHNATYDLKAIINNLWMEDLLDTPRMLQGLDVMTCKMHDTKIVAYLATNSTAGNNLRLKHLAHEFAGNWAVDEINDIKRIPLPKLLQYNLVDTLSTMYVMKKYWPVMVEDQQEELYYQLMLPSLKLIIQIEMTGMPLDRYKVKETRAKLEGIQQAHLEVIQNHPMVLELNRELQYQAMKKANAKLKTKQHPLEKFRNVVFNPNSGPQLQVLLYESMGLPVIDLTDTKLPATGADTLLKLIHHTQDQSHKDLIVALTEYSKVTKILSTFIPAFENALVKDGSGIAWLHGNFNLGGTVSGRLSSSDPNLQNLPSGSTYGKLIKECFRAPRGWIFGGADFNSLEDYISALTTKDPNKLAVYEQGFDGHCLRAAYYFREQCPEIDPTDPVSVNSMKKKYPELRQDSKGPTFALTYQGTWHTLVKNLGFDEEKAKAIEAGYHELYKVSDQYVQDRLRQASFDGYVTVAFGLRVRTPLLKQVIFNSSKMPYEAAAEGRTAGNALGQSYGLLNNRAAVEFMQKVWKSPFRHRIKPVGLIHDAIYILIEDHVETVEFANRELIKSMQWQELPEIKHDTVKLGAALDLFWPSWANGITLPNGADTETIRKICREGTKEYYDKVRTQAKTEDVPH